MGDHNESIVNVSSKEKENQKSQLLIREIAESCNVHDVENIEENIGSKKLLSTDNNNIFYQERSNFNLPGNDNNKDFISPSISQPFISDENSEGKMNFKRYYIDSDDDDDDDDEDYYYHDDEDDNYDDDDDKDENNLISKIPCSKKISFTHGIKAVTALAADPSGSRLASGSIDYDLSIWNFGKMKDSLKSLKTLQPCENHPLKCLEYSKRGEFILVISESAQAKILDKDGTEKCETVKGDQYSTDMAETQGHTATLNCGVWNPLDKEEYVTCSQDGTCRIWSFYSTNSHKTIKCKAQSGIKTIPTTCAYNREGTVIACGCVDGSIQMWDKRKNFVSPSIINRNSHKQGSEISCISFPYLGHMLATRSCDDTLKLWDLRSFRNPFFTVNIHSKYGSTNCQFSPDSSLIVTGESIAKGKSMGRCLFYDTKSLDLVNEIEVTNSHVIKTLWHPKLNQIFIGCGNGIIKTYYDEKKSFNGAKLCMVKQRHQKKSSEMASIPQIIAPCAQPLSRQDEPESTQKQLKKNQLDFVVFRKPDRLIKDPQGAILKFAQLAEECPISGMLTFMKSLPQIYFQANDVNKERHSDKKQRTT